MGAFEIQLTLGERQGLAQYAAYLREECELDYAPGTRVQPEGRTARGAIRVLVGKPPQIVLLERVGELTWEGFCKCAAGDNCVHCLAAAEHLVGLAPGGTKVRPDEQRQTVARVEAALKRTLTAEERGYVQRMATTFQRYSMLGLSSYADAVGLAAELPSSPSYALEGRLVPMPGQPKDAIELWHVLRRALERIGMRAPEFMEPVAREIPPPAEWRALWRGEDVTAWKGRLREAGHVLEEFRKARGTAPAPRRLRCVFDGHRLEIQWAEQGLEEWTAYKRTSFAKQFREDGAGTSPIAPDSELLAEVIRRHCGDTRFRFFGGDQYFDMGAILCAILDRPTLHAALVTLAGEPYRFPEKSLVWHVIEPGEDSGDCMLEMRTAEGVRLEAKGTFLKDEKSGSGYLLTPDTAWKLPQIPGPLGVVVACSIPREALQDEAGLRLLAGMGAVLPDSLEKLIERVPARLTYRFDAPVEGPGGPSSNPAEYVQFRAEVLDAEGRVLMKRSNGGWKPTRNGRSKDGRVQIVETGNLPDAETLGSGLGAKPEGDRMAVRVTRAFPEKFAAWAKSLPEDIELQLPPVLESILADPVTATVALKCEEAGVDWFDLSVEITPDNTELSPTELQLLLAAKGGYVRMGNRGWMRARFNLSDEDAKQLSALGLDPVEASGESQRLHTLHLASAATRKLLPAEHAEQVVRRQAELKTTVQPPVPAALQANLRPYQVEGFHFLAYLVENGFGGVLADDMGLGKTVQTLAWIAWLRERPIDPGPKGVVPSRVLIVCPKSVAPNWKAEAARFLPGLRVAVWSGSQPDAEFAAVLAGADALVMNYAQMRLLEEELLRQEWLAVVLDEAQAIKNPDSQTAKVARSLRARHRVALTGTPIENRLLDLWSIFAFAMPGVLGVRAKFQRGFAKMGDALARQRLATRVRPFLLRRTKGQVAQDLPPRIEEDVICELEGVQRDLYRAEYKKARALLLGAATAEQFNDLKFHFLTSLTRLRQICCHPALVDLSQRTQPSAKVEALADLLEPLVEEGHKVLVFSQFASMLELLQEEVRARQWTEFLLTGKTEDRGPLVDAFNAHAGAAVFLISLKAGGFGLNLTSASYVVLYDPWWNPAVEAQAIDRTHRIGQTQTVIAYRLIVKGSIEEKIRELQKAKSMMAGDILGEERFNQALTLEDFRFLFDTAEAGL